MEIIKQGVVYRATETPFRYQGWPSVAVDERGTLYAVFSGYRSSHVCPMGKTVMCVSYDGGELWSCPIIVNDTVYDDRDAGITYLSDGKMVLSWFHNNPEYYCGPWREKVVGNAEPEALPVVLGMLEYYEKTFGKGGDVSASFTKVSDDYGMSWHSKSVIPVSAPHGAVYTASGRLLYVGKCTKGRCEIIGNMQFNSADTALYESFDCGRSWKYVSTIPIDDVMVRKNAYEPHIAELADGTIVVAIRIGEKEDFTIYTTRSHDGGKTWDELAKTGICGSPPHLLVLRDGSLLLSYSRRLSPLGSRARISTDGGITFGDEILLSNTHHNDHGYAATAQLPDESFVTVYYERYADDSKTSILYTKWRL